VLSSIASLGIAFVSLLIALLALVLSEGNKTVKRISAVIFLALALVFFLIGLIPGLPNPLPVSGGNPSPFGCDSAATNAQDDLAVSLSSSTWYVIEDFDNSLTPPVHRFLAQSGQGSVIANALQGQRAWRCSNSQAAVSTATDSAISYKRQHPDHRVYGPNGEEIQ
jgi:hypothetical protein